MPTGRSESDTTESDYPSDGKNPFEGRGPSSEESVNGQAGGDPQHTEQADTTAEDPRAEPADDSPAPSEPEGTPDAGNEADTTAQEPTSGEETPTEEIPEDGDVDDSTEEVEASREDTDAPSEDAEPEEDELQVPFQYHGTEPDDEEHEDYVFISGVDPDQRYETVEDFVNSHEELLEHQSRQHEQIERLQSTLAEERASKEGDRAEMETKLSLYEETLGEDQIVEVMAERHMPEKFQGLNKEDVPADQQEEYIRARTKAEIQAEQELEEAEEARTQAQETAQERQERVQARIDEATERLEQVDHERLGLGEEEAEKYAAQALAEMSPEGSDKNAFDVAHQVYALNELLPDSVQFGESDAELAFDLLIDAVGAKAQQLKQQEMESRASKIRKKQQPRSQSRATPEPASEGSARREPGNPTETFRNAG